MRKALIFGPKKKKMYRLFCIDPTRYVEKRKIWYWIRKSHKTKKLKEEPDPWEMWWLRLQMFYEQITPIRCWATCLEQALTVTLELWIIFWTTPCRTIQAICLFRPTVHLRKLILFRCHTEVLYHENWKFFANILY